MAFAYKFFEAMALGVLSLLCARYIGGGRRFHKGALANVVALLTTWITAFLMKSSGAAAGVALGLTEHQQATYMEFMIPLLLAVFVGKKMLRASP